jgi:hypothetical protein
VAFGSGHRLACFQLGKPGIGFLIVTLAGDPFLKGGEERESGLLPLPAAI